MKIFFPFAFGLLLTVGLNAQKYRTQFNGFGHLEHYLDVSHDHRKAYFSIGEHDFFITSSLSDRISFLGEYVIRFNGNSGTRYLPSIERSFIKFNYRGNHNIIAGKIHTPVTYWNDVYHHGRLFYPVIERPTAYSHLIPLHTLGLQFQGQNIGPSNFGYDIMIGNALSSSDAGQEKMTPSLTAAFHVKPVENLRMGASYYYSPVTGNITGAHAGHADPNTQGYTGPLYKKDIRYHLTSGSLAWFGKKWELLTELNWNSTRSDSLGTAHNFATYLYTGLRISEKSIPYIHIDHMYIAPRDLHTYPYKVTKLAAGLRYEFNHMINLKMEGEYQQLNRYSLSESHSHFNLKMQLAYAF